MIHKLEADSILLTLNSREILSSVYIKCETGKITGLLGRNGNGKSCLMNVIYGTLSATTKSIRLDGTYLEKAYKNPDVLTYLFQANFIPKQLSLKRVFADYGIDYTGFENSFPEFKSKYNSQIKSLSGGEKRLVEIYLVLKSSSKFALLDEPFSMLSPISVEIVKELIKDVRSTKASVMISMYCQMEIPV